jgi:hypothetical protein
MPQQLADKWIAGVSLNPEAVNVPTDERPVMACREAIGNLLVDPDAPLPGQV